MTALSLKLLGQLDRQSSFVWVSTSQINWINKSMNPDCKQIGPINVQRIELREISSLAYILTDQLIIF